MAEIQRLKTEANRIIALLEEESMKDENLSPERKQNLTREVESLQVSHLYIGTYYHSLTILILWSLMKDGQKQVRIGCNHCIHQSDLHDRSP